MITLYRFDTLYIALGDDAQRLHEAGCGLHFDGEEARVVFPAESMGFFLWLALSVDDVALDGKYYRVSNRRFYQREFTRLMGQAHSKTKWWRKAVSDFEAQFAYLVSANEDATVFQQLLF